MNTLLHHVALLAVGLLLASSPAPKAATEPAPDFQAMRHAALDDIFVLQDYRAGKVSFVESPERHAGAWTHQGFRYTLADLTGQGSIRHIWTTRAEGDPYFDWEFFIDGETNPSLRATDVALVDAAARYPLPVAPANTVPLGNRDFNMFLPVPFEQSCRIEVVQRQPTFWLWFCQIDYRLQDEALQGTRLVMHPDPSERPTFSYLGLPRQTRREASSSQPRQTVALAERPLGPGARAVLGSMASGPAIVRELRLRWSPQSRLRLQMRFDDARGFAVDSPADRFFGPFQGVSFYRHATNEASCFLPMPFRRHLEVAVVNEGAASATVSGRLEVEPAPAFGQSWGYFHALHQQTPRTDGHRLHQVLYVRGRGHWLGMTLYGTGHDHGGGDFAVIDGEGDLPGFLHGVNGEDYFTFAWFGRGAHHPYAIAHSNDDGRYRHHFENVYPFTTSLALEWGAFAGLSPESVAVWYQDTPETTTLPDGARAESAEWDVFGPVPIPHDAAGCSVSDRFAVLPTVRDLDAGRQFECRLVKEHFTSGWMKEWSTGPSLNLTYIGRHGTKIDYEAELGGNGHAFLARRFLEWPRREKVAFRFAHDDPIELWINGRCVYRGAQHFNGFETVTVQVPLRKGRNEVLVRLTNYFNRNFNWTGFLLHPARRP